MALLCTADALNLDISMVCIHDFNQWDYLTDEIEIGREAIHNGFFSTVPVSFAGTYLHHADSHLFFSRTNSEGRITGQQGPIVGARPGLEGFDEILIRYKLEWDGKEYDPREFLYTFNRDTFALCGFYRKELSKGHVIAIFIDKNPVSDLVNIFDPELGLFRSTPGASLYDHIEDYLLKHYPDIEARRVTFRNVRPAGKR